MKYALALLLFCSMPGWSQTPKLEVTEINMENVAYPFAVKELPLEIQGATYNMAYMDVQPQKPNGKVVLLLHGKNFSGMYWEQTAKDLSAAGYRVIIPDQIGFGKSSKAHIQYSFQLLAQNTKKLLETLGVSKTAVLGHSMGGMLATRFALMYPDVVEKLILENPIGLEDWKTVVPYQTVDDWYASELKQDYAEMKAYQLEFYYGGQWKPEYDQWIAAPAGWTLNKDYAVVAKASARTYDMIFTQPVVYELPNVKVPTLLIIGQRDRTALGKAKAPKAVQETLGNYPELGKKAAREIPNAKLVPLDNVGHLPHIEAYSKFLVPLLDFLKT